jgi:hypothetical protein
MVEVPAIAKGDKRAPITGDAYTTFASVESLMDLYKDAFHGGGKAEDLPDGSLLGCATDPQDLRNTQVKLNGLLLANLEDAVDLPTQKIWRGPKNTL